MEESDKAGILTHFAETFCRFLEIDTIHQVLKDNNWNIDEASEILSFLSSDAREAQSVEKMTEMNPNSPFPPNSMFDSISDPWTTIESSNESNDVKMTESDGSDDCESDQSIEIETEFKNDVIIDSSTPDNKNYNLRKLHKSQEKYEGYVPYERIKKTRESIERIKMYVRENVRIMVIMRGLSGSGKSTLGKRIIDECGIPSSNYHHHIFSTDNYFIENGKYEFDSSKIHEAHLWNQKNVFDCARSGLTPIIIDNTNTRIYEMKVYAVIAVNKGYDIEIIEPDTSWAFNCNQLCKKSQHCPFDVIKRMYDRYEHSITPLILLKENGLRYMGDNMPPQHGVKRLMNERLKLKLDAIKKNVEGDENDEEIKKREERVKKRKEKKERKRKSKKESKLNEKEEKEEKMENKNKIKNENEKTEKSAKNEKEGKNEKNEKLVTNMILSFLDTDLEDSESDSKIEDGDSSSDLKSNDESSPSSDNPTDPIETSLLTENGKKIKNDTLSSSSVLASISIEFDMNVGKFVNIDEKRESNELSEKSKEKPSSEIKSNARGVFKLKNTLSKDDVNLKRIKMDTENSPEIVVGGGSGIIKNELIGDTGSDRYVNDLDGQDETTSSRFVNNLLENRKINKSNLSRKLDNKDQKTMKSDEKKEVKNNLGSFLMDKQQNEENNSIWKYIISKEEKTDIVEPKINKKNNLESSSNLPWTETEGHLFKDSVPCDNNSPFYGYTDDQIEPSVKINEDRTFNRLENIKKQSSPRVRECNKVNENFKKDEKNTNMKKNLKNDLKVANLKKSIDETIDEELNEIFPVETISLIKTLFAHYNNMDDICNELFVYGYALSSQQWNTLINLGKTEGASGVEDEEMVESTADEVEQEEDKIKIEMEEESEEKKKEQDNKEDNIMKVIKALYEMCGENKEKVKSCLEKQGYEMTPKQIEQLNELDSMKKEEDLIKEMERIKEKGLKELLEMNEIKEDGKSVLLCLEKSFVNQIEVIVGNTEENTFEDIPWVINVPVALVKHLHGYLMESVSDYLDQKSRVTHQSMMEDYGFSLSQMLEDTEKAESNENRTEEFSNEAIGEDENMGKLVDLYPTLDRDFLKEIYIQSGLNFENTVKFLNCDVEDKSKTNSEQPENPEGKGSGEEEEDVERTRAQSIKDSEYFRERANHYKGQWGKCNLLHVGALKANNIEMAAYMKDIMNQHRQRYELCNAMAASMLREKYDDGKHIDLHCFRVAEAIQVLDIAIDGRIRKLLTSGDSKTDLFIITGQGKNSPGGKPVIKPAVMARLKTRGISCCVMKDINPGVVKAVIKNTCKATGNMKP